MGCGAPLRRCRSVSSDECQYFGSQCHPLDLDTKKLKLAEELGEVASINGKIVADVPEAVIELTNCSIWLGILQLRYGPFESQPLLHPLDAAALG